MQLHWQTFWACLRYGAFTCSVLTKGVIPSCSFTFARVIPSCSFTFERVIPTLFKFFLKTEVCFTCLCMYRTSFRKCPHAVHWTSSILHNLHRSCSLMCKLALSTALRRSYVVSVSTLLLTLSCALLCPAQHHAASHVLSRLSFIHHVAHMLCLALSQHAITPSRRSSVLCLFQATRS